MAQAYTAPDWSSGEGISPSNLQSISNVLENIVQGTDRAIHDIQFNGNNISLTYVDGTIEDFTFSGLRGIAQIQKMPHFPDRPLNEDEYIIFYTDGTTYSFYVRNGIDGKDGKEGRGIKSITETHEGNVHTVTITFTDNLTQSFEIYDGQAEIIDDLTSTDKNAALSANMGRVLNEDLNQTNATLKAMSTMTSEDDLDYSIEGNIESARFVGYARKSKNLLDFNAFKNVSVFNGTKSVTDNSITLTATANDCYTSHVISSFPAIISAKSGDIITLSFDRNNTNSGSVHIWSYNESKGNGQLKYQTFNTQGRCSMTYTVPQDGFITIRLGVSTNGQSITYSNIMVEKSSSATAYEPYGIIKPSGVVESRGKNLFDESLFDTYTDTSVVYTSYKIKNGVYTMSSDIPYNDASNIFVVSGKVTSGASSAVNGVSITTPRTFTVTDGYYTVAYRSKSVNTNNPKDFNTMLNSGTNAEAYTPYETDSITLPYIPLGVNDIKDELIVNADGTGKFIKRVASLDMGTLDFSYSSANIMFGASVPNGKPNVGLGYTYNMIVANYKTSYSRYGSDFKNAEDKIICWGRDSSGINIKDTSYTDATTFKNAMNGVILYYELATPQEIALTAEEVAQILALKTFADVTYIDADGLAYDIGYLFNSAKAIKDLKDIINALTSTQTLEVADNANAPMSIKSVKKVDLEETPIEEITEEIPTEEV